MKHFLSKGVFCTRSWFCGLVRPRFKLAIHVSTVRCQYEESSCCASVPTSPRNLESFSVHQIVDPGIVEITLFQKANQTQSLHNFTLKMTPFFSISYQNVFLAHFRGFVAFVFLWFGLSKFQNLTVHVSIVGAYVVSTKNFYSGFEFNKLSTTKKKKKTKMPFDP